MIDESSLRGERIALPEALYFLIEVLGGLLDAGIARGMRIEQSRKRGTQNPRVGALVTQGCAQAGLGDGVAMGVWNALDEAVQSQAAKVVGHPALGIGVERDSEDRCQVLAEFAVGEAAR